MTDEEQAPAPRRVDLTRPMQTHILATALRGQGMMAQLRPDLNPDYFDDDSVSDIIKWSVNFWDEHKQVPSRQALLDVFRSDDDHKLIRALWSQDIDTDTKHTVARIREYAHLRAWRNAVIKAAEVISLTMDGQEYRDERNRKVEEPLVYAKALVDKANLVGKASGDLGDRWSDVLEANLAEILNPAPADVLGTGFPHLDAAGVVLERGELGCVLGVSKRGKSHILVNIAYHALKKGQNVVYYSLEMKNFRVFKRMYARLAGRDADMRQDPAGFVQAVRERGERFIKGQLVMKRHVANTATADDIRAHLTQLIASGFKPDVVVVDYAALMRPRAESGEKRHDLESVFLDLRSIAGEFDVRTWTAAQANRAAVNKPIVTMADFSECFAIVGHLDVGFSLCISDEERAQNKGRFFVLASRNEQDGQVIEFDFDYSRSIITTTGLVQSEAAKRPKATSQEQRNEATYQDAAARVKKKTDYTGDKP